MKKNISFLLAGVLLVTTLLSGCGGSSSGEGDKVLNIYNWTEYIPQEVYDQFEEETGIRVVESTFSSNEEMLAKLEAGGTDQYDLVVASNYVIDVMKEKNMIQTIDKDKIENITNISPSSMGMDYDPDNEYSIPFMATLTVIAINQEKCDELGVTINSFNDLLNPALENNIVVVDDSRELAAVALKATGQDPNSTDEATIEGALDWLNQLKTNIKAYDSDSPKTLLASNEVAVGLVYNMDAGQAIKENDQIKVVYTTEACEKSIDNFVITANSKNKEYAEEFINFVHRADVYKMILDEFPGVCLNDAAKELMDSSYLDNEGSNVDTAELDRANLIADVGEAATYYDDIFTKMKT
ncbi:MAG: extracellular solute-binding protein, family 1 [Oscillospiraceae bacterium]|nr:extracellular solute-binding protein, family 1 [Oscillospiraceae bacterium]